MKKIYAFPISLLLTGITANAQNISVNTTGAANSTLSMLEVLQISATANTKGLHISHSGAASTGYGLWVDVTGATNKYALVVPSGGGYVGIGTTTPSGGLLHISSAALTPLYLQTSAGYTYMGPLNAGWSHFYTDRPRYYFNTGGTFDTGNIGSYDEDLSLQTSGTTRISVLNTNGNVGLGVTNPAYNLEVGGTFGFGNGSAGSYRSRTETRNNAGLIASQSGFFETSAPSPSTSWPTSSASATPNFDASGNATSWWHLIDSRHSNNGNNYALQLAGGFFDQRLYFRKTNNNASQAWAEILTTSSNGYIYNQTTLQSSANYNISGSGNVQTSFQLQGTNAIFGNANDIYANIRVIQNNSSTLQDGMYVNYNSTGGAAAHLKFYANGTTERMRIDASSGNVGIGAGASPVYRLTVQGIHANSQIRLFSDEYGQGINGANTANMNLWASEPGMTWDGVGIGNNIYNTTSFPRVTTTRGGSYMRLLNNQINFNVVNNSGGDIPGLKVSPGSYGFGGIAVGQYHTLSSHSNSWLYMGDENGGIYGGRGLALANAYVASAFYYPNGTHGAGKVLKSDVNGYATWGNVWGGNIQYVSPTTDISTASSTMSDMAGVTITFTPVNSLVYVSFTAAGNYTGTLRPAQFAHFQIVKDGIVQKGTSAIVGEGDDWYGFQNTWNAAMIHPVSVTAGVATTIKVQWAFLSYSGTQTLWVRPSVEPVIHHRTLTILD